MPDIRSKSAWRLPQIESFLSECVIPIRLAVTQADQQPLVCSLWFVFSDGALWCATQKSASVVRFLEGSPYCGFEVAPDTMPYKGVRGQGNVTIDAEAGEAVLLQLIDRYVGTRESGFAQWLMESSSAEVAIRIAPQWYTSWDFSARMRD